MSLFQGLREFRAYFQLFVVMSASIKKPALCWFSSHYVLGDTISEKQKVDYKGLFRDLRRVLYSM